MTNRITNWLQRIARSNVDSDHDVTWAADLTEPELRELFRQFRSLGAHDIQLTDEVDQVLRAIVVRAAEQSEVVEHTRRQEPSDNELPTLIEAVYREWAQVRIKRHLLLVLLAWRATPSDWATFARLIVSDPPQDFEPIAESFAPLWKVSSGDYEALFPKLLDAVQHPPVAAVVLDFCNFIVRTGRIQSHPAIGREADWVELLGQIAERLEQFEERSIRSGVEDLESARTVSETVSLAVSLCHTMTLIQCRAATGKLFRLMELQHRRLRVEAAHALASFEESAGVDSLIEMASQPLVRLRVYAYATELGISDKIPEAHRSPTALAESELVTLLSEPRYFGLPPSTCELIEQRTLYWPSFDDPVCCYLFRYAYRLASGELQNIGIVGPETRTVSADLTVLNTNDVYSIFAGLDAVHDDLGPLEPHEMNAAQQVAMRQSTRWLQQQGYSNVMFEFMARFFGATWMVASVQKDGRDGTVVVDGTDVKWMTAGNPQRPIDAATAYAAIVGNNLLEQFNDDFANPTRP